MLAFFCLTKMASAVAAGSAGAHASQAGGGCVANAMGAVRDAAGDEPRHSDAARIEGEIQSHLEAIALYELEAASSDAQVRAFAQRILPQLQRHLAALRSLKPGN
jgi:predicted outer membrane protein